MTGPAMQRLASAWNALGLPVETENGELRTPGHADGVDWVSDAPYVSAAEWPLQEPHTGVNYKLTLATNGDEKDFRMHSESVPHPDFCELLTNPIEAPIVLGVVPGTKVQIKITANVFMRRERCERPVVVLSGSFTMPERVSWLGKDAPGLQMIVSHKGILYVHMVGQGAIGAIALRART